MKFIFYLPAALLSLLILTACAEKVKGEKAVPENGVFSFPADGLKRGDVRFYHYQGKKTITFILARAESGEVRAAFDACKSCFQYRRGYKLDGDRLVCVHCGTWFRLEELDKGKGNCVPIKIPFTLEGGRIIIMQADVEAGERWF